MKFQRRSANHISFMNSYTFGRAIDLNSDNDGTVTLTNIFDPEYNRGPADYDVTHTFSSNWIYELPWGGDSAWGGWQVSGILYLRSGIPFQITQSQSMLSTGITNNRPNQICDPVLSSPTIDQWFNTACFQQVADTTGTFGNTGRNSVRGPGLKNIDVSVIKNTKFGGVNSELRLEVFNLFNQAQFNNPERPVRQRGVRHDLVDRGEPVVRHLRHDRAADSAGGEAEVLTQTGSGFRVRFRVQRFEVLNV